MQRRGAAERLVWAVDGLALGPRAHVLEIGCGHGVAVSLVAERLAGGRITALDRSATMTAMASARNAPLVEAGVLTVVTAALADADLGRARFDVAFAVHVGVFVRGDPGPELAVLRQHLAPGAALSLTYQPLDRDVAGTVAAVSARLERSGYEVRDAPVAELASGPICSVVAVPAGP